MRDRPVTAAERWASDLAAWAVPDEIVAQAPEPPWGFPTAVFARRVPLARAQVTPARAVAVEALTGGGSVLDVGAGAGAASLALVPPATTIVAVDAEAAMLDELSRQAEQLPGGAPGKPPVQLHKVLGRWPDVASQIEPQDVGICHHVVYNVADIAPFVAALAERSRRRAVLVAPARHPLAWMTPLWERFWGLARPEGPTIDDLVTVLEELGIHPEMAWFEETLDPLGEPEAGVEQVAITRRRLCLPPERDPEVAEALAARPRAPWPVAALWWDGAGPAS